MELGEPPQPPLRHEHERPRADDAGDEAHREPDRQQMTDAHRGRQQHGGREADAHHPRGRHAQRGATDGADEIPRIVRRREPAAGFEPERAVGEHQRQQRREREPADAERDREPDHAGERRRARTAIGVTRRMRVDGGGRGIGTGHGAMDRRDTPADTEIG